MKDAEVQANLEFHSLNWSKSYCLEVAYSKMELEGKHCNYRLLDVVMSSNLVSSQVSSIQMHSWVGHCKLNLCSWVEHCKLNLCSWMGHCKLKLDQEKSHDQEQMKWEVKNSHQQQVAISLFLVHPYVVMLAFGLHY